jgi:hypothetical protein
MSTNGSGAGSGAPAAPPAGPLMYVRPSNAILEEFLKKRLDEDAPEPTDMEDIRITDFDGETSVAAAQRTRGGEMGGVARAKQERLCRARPGRAYVRRR